MLPLSFSHLTPSSFHICPSFVSVPYNSNQLVFSVAVILYNTRRLLSSTELQISGALLSSGTSDEEIRHSDGTSSKVFLSITLSPISLINVTNAGYFDQIGIS